MSYQWSFVPWNLLTDYVSFCLSHFWKSVASPEPEFARQKWVCQKTIFDIHAHQNPGVCMEIDFCLKTILTDSLNYGLKTFRRIPTSFLEVVIKIASGPKGGRKMAKKLENWTLTPDGKSILELAVSLHVPDRMDDALSNEHILGSTGPKIRHRMTKKCGEVENREPILVLIKIQEFATKTRRNSTHIV